MQELDEADAAQRDADEPVSLSAQHLTAGTARGADDVRVFRISDGEQTVEISHEIGDPEVAAKQFDELSRAAAEHAERIRLWGRSGLYWP